MSTANFTARHKLFEPALIALQAGDSPLMIGPSGSGKTTLAEQVAMHLEVPFSYIGSVTSDFQLKGFKDAHGNTVKTEFRKAYEEGGVFLLDELDSSDSKALVSLHSALSNGHMDGPDGMIERHPDFRFIASANTWGHGATLNYMGRNPLDGATLDRFATFFMDYDEEFERKVIHDKYKGKHDSWVTTVQQARAAVRELQLRHIVSMRASFNGAALLEAGLPLEDTFNARVLRGLNHDDATKLTNEIENNGKTLLKALEQKKDITALNNKIKKALKAVSQKKGLVNQLIEKATDLSSNQSELEQSIQNLESSCQAIETMSKTCEALQAQLTDAQKQAQETLKKFADPAPK